MDNLEKIYSPQCECVEPSSGWPYWKRCENNATVALTGGIHEGHKMCNGHFLEYRIEAELDGFEALG